MTRSAHPQRDSPTNHDRTNKDGSKSIEEQNASQEDSLGEHAPSADVEILEATPGKGAGAEQSGTHNQEDLQK